ncbi:Hypothetical protein ETEE_2061 [Edwardsiella anguillarum ET080813]|uniref:Uncharacterized protein n=1 Tax=Edwardsiella anguillarum ET080813 TaxID=667120 RepID=A0A076LKW6_9GAMM|nr:Hypothetical protein ETEE_2061 [Edwardsiella anguillarum ET080813]
MARLSSPLPIAARRSWRTATDIIGIVSAFAGLHHDAYSLAPGSGAGEG